MTMEHVGGVGHPTRVLERVSLQVRKISRSLAPDKTCRGEEAFALVVVHVGPFAVIGFDPCGFSAMLENQQIGEEVSFFA